MNVVIGYKWLLNQGSAPSSTTTTRILFKRAYHGVGHPRIRFHNRE